MRTKTETHKERPILFSGAMVRAILAGNKTQTRRIVTDESLISVRADGTPGKVQPRSRYGAPGDRLVVKEAAWMWCAKVISGLTKKRGKPKIAWCQTRNTRPVYCADHPEMPAYVPEKGIQKTGDLEYQWHKKIGRFLPRWASRITLEITGIRVERLQDISEADAIAEGIEQMPEDPANFTKRYWRNYLKGRPGIDNDWTSDAVDSYAQLWESINGPGSWEVNPWVWVVEFKKLEGQA